MIPAATAEGLTAVRLSWREGRLLDPQPLESGSQPPEMLVLPRLVDPHVHLDKAFTWSEHPNLSGTYDGALEANLREHAGRDADAVRARGGTALTRACEHGLRAVRTHIDSLGPGAMPSWEALEELKSRWRKQLEVQLVALVPIAHWATADGARLAKRVAAREGLLGGVLVPPCHGPSVRRHLRALLQLAEQHGCPVDLHIDEADHGPAAGLHQLLHVLERFPCSQRITCSHASSLALLDPRTLERLAARMAAQRLQVVALPLTNGWLLSRTAHATPVCRPLAPIRQLQRAGITVAVGGDNVADPWFPGGDFDPLALMASSLPLAQLAPWQRLGLSPFTTAAAQVMDLAWDGVICRDAPADLVMVQAQTWSAALRRPPQRRVLIAGRWWEPPRR
ncbi:MAG: amidohydrolase family protein [Cyanobacteriota bacterium]|nr:amidohydrolase family protein [Cyanobacteriota bacterium]